MQSVVYTDSVFYVICYITNTHFVSLVTPYLDSHLVVSGNTLTHVSEVKFNCGDLSPASFYLTTEQEVNGLLTDFWSLRLLTGQTWENLFI